MDWSRKWFVHFNAEKTQIVSLDCSDNSGAIQKKVNESIHNRKCSKFSEVSCENVLDAPEKVIYDFSNHKLTEAEKSVLCKGLQFAVPPKKLKYVD